jgi:hypothetical protein
LVGSMNFSFFKGGRSICKLPYRFTDEPLPAWRKILSGAGRALRGRQGRSQVSASATLARTAAERQLLLLRIVLFGTAGQYALFCSTASL